MAELMRLPDTELEIMKVIWESGRTLSTSEVKASLEEQRPWNVSALQTLLNRLIDRGFLESYKEGKNRFYTPLVAEKEYLAVENKAFLEKVNNLGIGPQGLGGRVTALWLAAETYPTHIGGLPVAVNLNCHVARHETESL